MPNNYNNALPRRTFLRHTSLGIAGTIMVPSILPSCAKGANDRLLIGHIGLGSRGQEELKNYFVPLTTAYSAATCDTYTDRRKASAAYINHTYSENGIKAPRCREYADFEEILSRSDIDAVHITTPDHWHVPLAIKAARAGKHIMLAKPLGLGYPEYKILEQELSANQVKFHYGCQQRSMRHLQLGTDMIREGLIGDIERIEVWAPGYNPVESPVCIEEPVPPGFDYDKWTGPAPLNPYCSDRVTNNSSWFQWDYSIGFLAGWGAHPLDVMIWALKDKLSGKYTCEGTGEFWKPGGIYNNIRAWDVTCIYDQGIQLRFVDADLAVGSDMLHYRQLKETNGTTFFGTKGWISLSRSSAQSNIPGIDAKLNGFPKNDSGWIRGEENIMGQLFIDVIKGKIPEVCPLSEAVLSDCVSHMSNIAIRTGRKITWDPVSGLVLDNPEANRLFVRECRAPYTI